MHARLGGLAEHLVQRLLDGLAVLLRDPHRVAQLVLLEDVPPHRVARIEQILGGQERQHAGRVVVGKLLAIAQLLVLDDRIGAHAILDRFGIGIDTARKAHASHCAGQHPENASLHVIRTSNSAGPAHDSHGIRIGGLGSEFLLL